MRSEGPSGAEDELIAALERYPYCLDLFSQVAARFTAYGLSEAHRAAYTQAADRADALSRSGNALLLGNQRPVDRYVPSG